MRSAILVVGANLTIAVALVAVAGAQSPVPVDQEPHHRPVFANRYVRVLDVKLEPGYVSLLHTHVVNNVFVPLAAGTLRVDGVAEVGVPREFAVGRIGFALAPPAYTHRVVNVGATLVHMLDVELLHPQTGTAVDDDLTRHEIALENEQVRATRIALNAGDALPAHSHPTGWLEVVVRGTDAGAYRWHDAGSVAPAVTASVATEVVEIEPK